MRQINYIEEVNRFCKENNLGIRIIQSDYSDFIGLKIIGEKMCYEFGLKKDTESYMQDLYKQVYDNYKMVIEI